MLRTFIAILSLTAATPVFAQQPSAARGAALDAAAGYAGFVDEALVDHLVLAATVRYHVTRGISIGPEIVYMTGPGHDRDLFLTANVVFDVLPDGHGARAGTIHTFLVAGAGLMRHSNRFGTRAFSAVEGAVTAGGGVRVWLGERVYAAGEARLGWEPHVRLTGGLGVLW